MSTPSDMYDEFSKTVISEEKISNDVLLDILKDYAGTISVFDLMEVNAEMIEDSKYVQDSYKKKSHGVYAKYFLGRIKEIRDNNKHYTHRIDKEEFIDAVATLKSYEDANSMSHKTKFPLIYAIVSLYTTFLLREPIHPVGTPFPGSLQVEIINGNYYCPVKDANIDSPNAVCKMCIAEQLDF